MILTEKLLKSWSNLGHRFGGHIFGQCMVATNPELLYVHIPKNASTWSKTQLSPLGFEADNYLLNPDLVKKPTLVILRDPVERWISGISWYMTLNHQDLLEPCETDTKIRSTILSIMTTRVVMDPHTIPQSVFLQGIDFFNTTFIMVRHNNDDYRENFSQFFKKELGIDNFFDQAPFQHVAEGNPTQSRWVNIFQSALDDDYIKKIQKFYQEDIQLINKIKFYE
jgi:hypothetical protein